MVIHSWQYHFLVTRFRIAVFITNLAKLDEGPTRTFTLKSWTRMCLRVLGIWGFVVDQCTFMPDSALAHMSRRTKQWFEEHGLEVLDWPASASRLQPHRAPLGLP